MDNTENMAELHAQITALHAAVRALYAYAPPDAQALLIEMAQEMDDAPQPHPRPETTTNPRSIAAAFLRKLLRPNAD